MRVRCVERHMLPTSVDSLRKTVCIRYAHCANVRYSTVCSS